MVDGKARTLAVVLLATIAYGAFIYERTTGKHNIFPKEVSQMANVRAMTVREAKCLVEESAEYNEYFDRTTSVFNEAIRDAAKSGSTSVDIYSPVPNHQYMRYLADVISAFRSSGFKVLKHEIIEDTAYTTVEWGD